MTNCKPTVLLSTRAIHLSSSLKREILAPAGQNTHRSCRQSTSEPASLTTMCKKFTPEGQYMACLGHRASVREVAGAKVILTTGSYRLSAPLAESTIEEMPAVSTMSAAMFPAIIALTPEWLR